MELRQGKPIKGITINIMTINIEKGFIEIDKLEAQKGSAQKVISAKQNKLKKELAVELATVSKNNDAIFRLFAELENEVFVLNSELIRKAEDDFDSHIQFAEPRNSDDIHRAFEDDGTLHLTIGKIRLCFISNQEITQAEWNRLARPIVEAFNFKWSDLNK